MELTAPHQRFHASGGVAAVGKLSSNSSSSAPASSKSSAASSPHNSDDPQRLLRSVDSTSSLSSTVYEEDEHSTPHRPGSAPPNLAFESSGFFNFGGPSAFFSHMKYDDELPSDEFPEALASPTDNNDILPPHVLPPTNQTSHDVSSSSSSAAVPAMSQGFAVQQHRYSSSSLVVDAVPSAGTPAGRSNHHHLQHSQHVPTAASVPALPKHRKNSIEMFLSQSPSQSLGGDFLKISLEDHSMSLHASDRSSSSSAANAFASGHFTLNPVPESPKKFGRTSSHVRLQAQQVVAQAQPERFSSGTGAGALDVPPPLMSRSSSASSYSNYQLSPRMGSEDSWHSSQDGGQSSSASASAAYYQDHASQDYYGGHAAQYGAAGREQPHAYHHVQHQSQQQHHHHSGQQRQQQQDHGMYRGGQSLYGGGGGYGRNHQANGGQWNSNVANSGGAAYSASDSGMYMNAHQSQLHYQQSSGGGGMRGGRGNRNNHGGYARMTPPLPEASPPLSPRKPLGLGLPKQCKFFLQGHCRMGNKCKFAHQVGANQSHGGLAPHLVQPTGALGARLYHQPMQMSPHQQHHGHGHQDDPTHSFGRPQSRNGYRQSELSGGFSGALGGGGGVSGLPSSALGGITAPGLIAHGDSATLSAALSVEDIHGRVFAMSKDQNGCRLLQEQLDYEDREDLCDVIYRESLEHLAEMMVDPFGNYLFQKLLERVDAKQRLAIIRRVSSNLVAAALNLHGTRSVQKVVEVCATSPEVVEDDGDDSFGNNSDDNDEDTNSNDNGSGDSGARGAVRRHRTVNLPDIIVDALKDDAVRLCIDSNGNHVIQRALQFMQPEYNQFVFDAVCKECTTVGTHRHGCCVLQRCLDAANKTQKADVIAQVERQAMKLMQDPYGNYVVQYVLDSCTAEEAYGVIVKPLGSIFELSVQKFSSNVIEKCLEKAPERVRQRYIQELIECPKMHKMLQDQFANYVVQRALCVCSEEQCLQLVKSIRPHLACMKNTSGGRRITARILKRFPTMDISMDMGMSPTSDAPNGMYDVHQQQHQQYHSQHQHQQHHAQQLSRLPSIGAMGYGHQQQHAMHGGYSLSHPSGMSGHASSAHNSSGAGGYHHHLPPAHSSSSGLMGDVSGLGVNSAAGTSRA